MVNLFHNREALKKFFAKHFPTFIRISTLLVPFFRRERSKPAFEITRSVYEEIREAIGSKSAEFGGMLGGLREDYAVRAFYFDSGADRSSVTYTTDTQTVNRVLREDWNPQGTELLGFVHSHPPGLRRPSGGDLVYAERILNHIPSLSELLIPIVMSAPDNGGSFELLPFAAVRGRHGIEIEERPLWIIEEPTHKIKATARWPLQLRHPEFAGTVSRKSTIV